MLIFDMQSSADVNRYLSGTGTSLRCKHLLTCFTGCPSQPYIVPLNKGEVAYCVNSLSHQAKKYIHGTKEDYSLISEA